MLYWDVMVQKNVKRALLASAFFFSVSALSAPSTFSYQGRIVGSDGKALEYGSVSFEFTVTSPDGVCVLYREVRNGVDMRNSKGVFETPIGSGTKSYPASPSFTLLDAFNNGSGALACDGGATYTPAADDGRRLRVQFYDGSGWKLISPDQIIHSVPYAGFASSANKLGNYGVSSFVLKSGVPSCVPGTTFLSFDGATFTCEPVSGSAGGTVTSVTVAAPLSVTNGTSTPNITLQVATSSQNGYLSSADWTTFNNKLGTGSTFAGDVSGTSSTTSVDKIKGTALAITSLASGQFLKFNGTNWVNGAIAQSDITGLSTTLSGMVLQSQFPASCAASQTLTFISPSGLFTCSSIAIAGSQVTGNIAGNAAGFTGTLAGDVSGNQNSTVVDKIKGVAVAAPTTAGQVLRYNGTSWVPTVISTGDLPSGAVTTAGGTSGYITYFNGTNTLANSLLYQTTNYVGIGTTNPQAAIDIQTSNAQVRVANSNSGGQATLSATTYGGSTVTNAANLNLTRWRGTLGSPAVPQNGDQLGVIAAYGGATPGTYTPGLGAKIQFTAEETFSATASGANIGFYTQPAGASGGLLERVHIGADGKVGIGMPSSSDLLQVKGKVGFGAAGSTSGQTSFYPANVANTYFHLENKNDNTLRFSSGAAPGGTDIMTLDNNSRVGIGTTAPTEKLEVVGKVKATELCIGTDCKAAWPSGGGSGDVINGGNTVAATMKLGSKSNYDLYFITNDTTRMTITKDGYVGIGVSNPDSPLIIEATAQDPTGSTGVKTSYQVAPSANSNANFYGVSHDLNTTGTNIVGDVYGMHITARHTTTTALNSMNGLQIDAYQSNATGSANYVNGIEVNAYSDQGNVSNITGVMNNVTNYNNFSVNSMRGQSNVIRNTSTGTVDEMMGTYIRVENSGTLNKAYGVYVSDPDNSGGATFTNWYGLYLEDPIKPTNAYSIYSNGAKSYFKGSIGVGMTSPNAMVAVRNPSSLTTNLIDATSSNPGGGQFMVDSWGNAYFWGGLKIGWNNSLSAASVDGSGDHLYLTTSTSNKNVILYPATGGKVGVGTTSPSEMLEVNGNIKVSGTVSNGNSWVTATLINSWADYGSGFAPVGYKKFADGIVRLRGLIKSGAGMTNAFVLPTGFRPGYNHEYSLACQGSTPCKAIIQADGSVYIEVSSAAWTSLDGVWFEAGQ